MADELYEYGSSPTITATIKNAAGTIVDPATLTFKFKQQTGATTTYVYLTDAQLERVSTGVYKVELLCDGGGYWYWQYAATTPDCVLEGRFKVKDSVI